VSQSSTEQPESTAARVALWRALHVELDAPPHVLADSVGLALLAPPESWRERGDMHPQGTRGYRASIVARARFIEDLVQEQAGKGVGQYVLLGAGLDSFAQRRPELASKLQVFEVDQPGPQAWKERRLLELGLGKPAWLHFVPVNFESGPSWRQGLAQAGFDAARPAVVSSTGVTMYLSQDAILAMLREVTGLAPGSTLAVTFLLPLELVDAAERPAYERVLAGARASGTPFVSLLRPQEMLALGREAGFREVRHVGTGDLVQRYFTGRSDGLKPSMGESFLIATV
jgi:methyltransferase (TIGR00027 family)